MRSNIKNEGFGTSKTVYMYCQFSPHKENEGTVMDCGAKYE